MTLQFGQRIIFLFLFCFVNILHAQTVYYPAQSSDLIRSSADDVAELLNKAIPGSSFTTHSYSSLPQSGIIFIYDSLITNNQACKIESDGNSYIKFSASQDNGLCFGIYNYLNSIGFKFYLPGSIWEKIPNLSSPYQTINKTVSGTFKYNSWFISGGHNRWVMDNEAAYGWDTYFGKNGHEWARYQRRNNMTGAYRFTGHRGDILNTDYLSTLQTNPCFVSCHDGLRLADAQSTPDINNIYAEQLWASAIESRYTSYKNIITSNPVLYRNYYHNFNFYNQLIGIEVPDGSRWGNSIDKSGCFTGNYNGNPYPKESDQQFILANFTATKINTSLSDKHFQCYAYSNHADVPSENILLNKNIDVQVVPTAFQIETSAKALMNRWYKRHSNISEYHYLNIPQWTGEMPLFSLPDYKNTLSRLKEKNSQGIVIETSPAKFASLPFLFAGNRFLINNISVDSSLNEFVNNMFPVETGVYIKQLLNYWGDENVFSIGNFTGDNKYKIPLYLQQLNKAISALHNTDENVTARLQELKAYLHYMVLYYDFIADPKSYESKSDKASAICLYLAKINKLQLVNSYYLILDLVRKYPLSSLVYEQFNVLSGTAYQQGNLSLITNSEIDKNFTEDLLKYQDLVTDYKFENAKDIISKMATKGLKPLDKIHVKIAYTNGVNYYNRSEFYFYASSAGVININCIPHFGMPGKGFINIAAEADDKALLILKDETITPENNLRDINISVPSPGIYKLSVVSQYQTSADISIVTNGNTFFKKGPFYGDKVENYRDDNWTSLPKYCYVPDVSKLYFSINGACYTNNCLTGDGVVNAFGIKDVTGKNPVIEVSASDPSLFSIALSAADKNNFLQISKMREYNLCFANISNIEIYAEQQPEAAPLPLQQQDATVYPNPSTGIFNFKKGNSSLVFNKINIYNAQGKKVTETANVSNIDLSTLPAGIYFYTGQKENETIKGKLIKH